MSVSSTDCSYNRRNAEKVGLESAEDGLQSVIISSVTMKIASCLLILGWLNSATGNRMNVYPITATSSMKKVALVI